ncbi:uncharacterized protein LOC116201323 [Punica granatum]|uniref:Uncharacterized protein LOC116201323 n=1 Tax=Punica granatum TaxID=22663 RepID=A0A6P8D484_PUNGR|nr:uncharacterized protein LOC116201323 [Punica granatum]XP_031388386.1 uncharacterized protein LOC116201323 [Punica granatum]
MASTAPSSDVKGPKTALSKQVISHEVSIAELSNLSSSRAVYVKTGNLYFRTNIQKAKALEQNQLESAKAKLEKLNAS